MSCTQFTVRQDVPVVEYPGLLVLGEFPHDPVCATQQEVQQDAEHLLQKKGVEIALAGSHNHTHKWMLNCFLVGISAFQSKACIIRGVRRTGGFNGA